MSTYPRIEVAGVPMDDAAGRWFMDPTQTLRALPGRRATSVPVPGRQGVIWPRADAGEINSFPIVVTVLGDGSTMDARVASLHDRLDALGFLFNAGSVVIDYFASASRVYRAEARMVAAVQPAYGPNLDVATVTYVMEIPDGVWRSPDPGTYSPGQTISTPVEIPFMAGSTAVITDTQFMLRGPFTAITLASPETHQQLQLQLTVASGKYLFIDCGTQLAQVLGAPDWSGVGTDVSGQVITKGPGSAVSWLNLYPTRNPADVTDRSVRIQLNILGQGTGWSWTVRGKAAYL